MVDQAVADPTQTLIVAIVGIAVAGVIGPAATAWATRRANRQQFERQRRVSRQDDLRVLADEAARLLGAGVTNLRIGREASERGADEPDEVKEWASDVHLLLQRLLLRRAADDEVVTSYRSVLDALAQVGEAATEREYDLAVDAYKHSMDSFLARARLALSASVAEPNEDDT